jgi:predicted Zn finger-like uncharacterized protein
VVLRCSACQATYRIDGERVQNTRLKVRCPSCGHVFRVRSAVRQPAYAGGTPSGPTSFGATDFVRDERRPPQTLPHRSLPRMTPSRPMSPPEPPRMTPSRPPSTPEPRRWDRERTIDFDAGRRAETPRLETEPFRAGHAPAPAAPATPSEPRPAPVSSPPPFETRPLDTLQPQAPVPQPEKRAHAPRPAAPPSWPEPPVAPPSQQSLEAPRLEPDLEPPPIGTLPTSPRTQRRDEQAAEPVPESRVPTAPPVSRFSETARSPGGPSSAVPEERHERALRLARVLVSDILVYNQEARDRALREGNLASALGGEINRAWEMYKSKVDAHVLHSTSFFKDALNEILANGQRLF